jgi:transcriptional regulator of acetoin/glycerol metabolism
MATALSDADIRAELRALGERRNAKEQDDKELAEEVEKALRKAYGHVTVAEAARLLHMHRTTVYRVYHPHSA